MDITLSTSLRGSAEEETSDRPCSNGVNWKSGRSFRSLALLAVFLYCPSALDVSNCNQCPGSERTPRRAISGAPCNPLRSRRP